MLLAACNKSPVVNGFIKSPKNDPVMSARNIDLLFSDSGRIEARLTSPLMNRFAGETPFLEFPTGFKVTVFDSLLQVSSTITANRGIRKENTRIMEAWGNVVVRNEKKNEQLNTEHLVWDENKRLIWSDVKVRITRPDQVLNGSSMQANDSFTSYIIEQATGLMNVKQDSI
jgi:LPS export ABC transporter protein LptC